ncbi:MAG: hypothetical protein U5L98_08355 [Halomonas sp.]|uniref:hypothetical protein n=1 Tax=Halomonas sp. TaxID=1486246 RepID=UPI002ACF0242|nr:hypothetical protein [Halomonas sp.]MDZ7852640.1 hypothetical protein [Halomonas sp.]
MAERLGLEAREIAEAGRTGDRDGIVARAIFGTMFGRKPSIGAMPDEDRNAELLVLCAPVWATQLPGAVKTYLDDYAPRHVELVTINQGNRNKRARARADEMLQLTLPKGSTRLDDLSPYRRELHELAERLSGSQ